MRTTRAVGQELLVLNVGGESEIEAAFASLPPGKADGLLVASDPVFSRQRERIIALAATRRLPAIFFAQS